MNIVDEMQAIIKTENLIFKYAEADEPALNGVNISVLPGSFTVILGRNGSGKSTLARHFNGLLLPSSGKVTVAGMDTCCKKDLMEIRRTVGLVFQNPDNQLVASVVEEDVAFAPENLGLPPAEIRRRVDEALKLVDMYDHRFRPPHQLSGGQKQRVAIAGIIAMEPQCLVLDEPTAMLDPAGRREVMDTIHRLCREKGLTVVLITHHMSEALEADKVYVVDQGKVVLEGAPQQVFALKELRDLGLDMPDGLKLMSLLREGGMELPEKILTNEECAFAIKNALERGKE